jgi:hypothetical protein
MLREFLNIFDIPQDVDARYALIHEEIISNIFL